MPNVNAERDLLTIRNNLEVATSAERDRPFAQLQARKNNMENNNVKD